MDGADGRTECHVKRLAMSLLFALVSTAPVLPSVSLATTVAEAAAAGGRAMNAMDPERKAWLRTLPPKDQQLVICVTLVKLQDQAGIAALDCEAAATAMPKPQMEALAESWKTYQATDGRTVLTANDMARVAPGDREAVRRAVACRQIRDKITAQVSLVRQGSSGYWNMDQLQEVERQNCGDNMDINGP